MDEYLKFLGFQDPWKKGQDAVVTGLGSVPEGATVAVPEDLAAFLLTSQVWERGNAADVCPRQPESTEPAEQVLVAPDPFVGALTDGTAPEAPTTETTDDTTTGVS